MIAHLKRAVVDLRKVLGAQRDVFQRLTSHAITEQGGQEMSIYYRDVYDHIVRQYETADSLRDLLTSTMDVYLSTVSNRLNDVMRRLTVIATLFMPLSFITGFFGMNFAWLVNHITTTGAFALGITAMLGTVLMQFLYFRRRGWV
jgi:magnesium transporter